LPAYFFNAPHIWLLARDARDRARAVVAANLDASAVDAVAAVILAAAASEGFIKELSELCAVPRAYQLAAPLGEFGRKLQEMEGTRSPTPEKYKAATAILSGKAFDNGGHLSQDFRLLFKVRDALIHIKAIDQAGPLEGDMTTFTMPDFVKEFQRRGLAKASTKDIGAGWLDALETDRMASWACETALNMMLAVLGLIPDCPSDPTSEFKRMLRRHKNSS
jgi:hypothetical protein